MFELSLIIDNISFIILDEYKTCNYTGVMCQHNLQLYDLKDSGLQWKTLNVIYPWYVLSRQNLKVFRFGSYPKKYGNLFWVLYVIL